MLREEKKGCRAEGGGGAREEGMGDGVEEVEEEKGGGVM